MSLKFIETRAIFRQAFMLSLGALLALTNHSQAADEALTVKLGLGVGTAPDYVGSNDYTVIPLPNFELRYGEYAVRSSRLGLEADVVGIRGLDAGPIIRYDRGRSSKVKDSAVMLLPKVDGSVELGAFVGVGVPLSVLGAESQSIVIARLEALSGLGGGHEGMTAGASVGLVSPLTESLTVISSLSSTYMSGQYAESYFDVSTIGSTASGLPTFSAGSGFRDIGLTAVATYKINDNWSVNGIGSYTRLIGDAARSPIVKQSGSSNQFLGGLGFTYTFR